MSVEMEISQNLMVIGFIDYTDMTKYRIFTKEIWFDFDGPKYLIGKGVTKEAIDTRVMFFWIYQN